MWIDKNIKRKSLIRFFICLLISLLFVLPIFIKGYTINDITNNNCVIETLDDIKVCVDSGEYFVNIKSNSIINPNYVYSVGEGNNKKDVAMLLDVGISVSNNPEDGYVSLIGLVPIDLASSLISKINNNESVEIFAHLGKFTEDKYIRGYNYIKNSYVDYYTSQEYENNFGMKFTKEEAESFIMDVNFDNYSKTVSLKFMYLYLGVLIACIVFFLVLSVYNLVQYFNPRLNKIYRNLSGNEIDNALESYLDKEFIFENNNLKITDEYFFVIEKKKETMGRISDIVWLYGKKINLKNNDSLYSLVINLNNGKSYEITLEKENIQEVMDVIKKYNAEIITDFTKEYVVLYKRNPSEFLKKTK